LDTEVTLAQMSLHCICAVCHSSLPLFCNFFLLQGLAKVAAEALEAFIDHRREAMKGKKLTSKWDQRMQELKDYMKKFGHTQVKASENRALHGWLRHNRNIRFGPHGDRLQLTQEEMNMLDEVDPNWHVPIKGSHQQQWDAQIAGLESFRQQHGLTAVMTHGDEKSLHKFVWKCKEKHRNGNLSQEQLNQLKELGIEFEDNDTEEDQDQMQLNFKLKQIICCLQVQQKVHSG